MIKCLFKKSGLDAKFEMIDTLNELNVTPGMSGQITEFKATVLKNLQENSNNWREILFDKNFLKDSNFRLVNKNIIKEIKESDKSCYDLITFQLEFEYKVR